MKHSTDELLLAVEVRRMAHDMQVSAMRRAAEKIRAQSEKKPEWENSDSAWDAAKPSWVAEHPLDEFIPQALAELERVADLISPRQKFLTPLGRPNS